MKIIQTERLILRPWKEEDKEPFAEMSKDPRVMEYFPSTLTRLESDALVERFSAKFQQHGWGLWAVGIVGGADFIGFIGLNQPSFTAHFTPCVEIGWRLAYEYWAKGYATEGAKASLEYGFNELHLDEIVAFTTLHNTRSQAVMQKLGMKHNPLDDFDHPGLEKGHPLCRHVLYRKRRV